MSRAIDWDAWGPEGQLYRTAYRDGRYDAPSYLQFIYREADAMIWPGGEVAEIGRAGGDGITFCLRRGKPGIWAHYPVEDRFQRVADDLAALERGWTSGEMKL